jgi:hypothetical protein
MKRIASAVAFVAGCFNLPAPPPDAKPGLGPWGPASPAFTAMRDDDPTLTDDMLEMYFNRASDIYVTTRASTSDPWGTPMLVAELSSSFSEETPEIVGDGLTIYFASDRTLTAGGEDIFRSTRKSRTLPWSEPVNVAELSSPGFDGAATRDADGFAFVLYSDRTSTYEIYETVRPSTELAWPPPSVHSELSSGIGGAHGANPMLSLDSSTIYYDAPVSGGGDLYMATRRGFAGAFDLPLSIAELNTALYIEEDPWVSPDGHHIFFASNRDGTEGIYEASR